jgi:N-acyl-D-amino-acid deacylase
MSIDLLITGGKVIDGTGRPPYRADVAVRDGNIVDVGVIETPHDFPTLDARGLVVTPGFIDIHSHSDFTLVVDPRAVSQVTQGVTLEVVGNCGHGCAPMADPALVQSNLYGYQSGYPFTWQTFAEYLDTLESRQPALNVAALVPNGNLRLAVAGLVGRPSTPDELRQMTKLLDQSLEEGAFGYSTGLEYSIERDCSEEEIQELCRTTQRRGRYYATHTRNRQGESQESIAEAIRAAEASAVPLQISHITCVARLTDQSRWAIEQALAQVDQACRRGTNVGFDMHTRSFGTTQLSAALPSSALEGGKSAIAKRLKDPSTRKEFRAYPSIVAALARGDWGRIIVFEDKVEPGVSRRSIAELSRERGTDPLDTICDLLLRHIDDLHSLMIIAHAYREEEIQIAFEHPGCMVGSDATALALDGPLQGQSFHGAYSWAAWFLRHFVRDKKLLSLEEAVRRITALPAQRLGLADRGVIRKGAWADLAVFDPEAFRETATTFEPNRLAVGMRHVLVNGVVAMKNGELTGNRAGQVLRAR